MKTNIKLSEHIGSYISLNKNLYYEMVETFGQSPQNFQYFIESGTFCGCTLWEMKDIFQTCISIELSDLYFGYNLHKFENVNNVSIYKGDSGEILSQVLDEHKISENAVFFLDGHYSGGMTAKCEENTPLRKELKQIASKNVRNSIIIIDDYHLYPICHSNEIPTILNGKIKSKIQRNEKLYFLL